MNVINITTKAIKVKTIHVDLIRSHILDFVEIDKYLHKLFAEKDITSLTIQSFEQAFYQLNQLLPPRLLQIQEYCQSIEELELERIHKVTHSFSLR